MREGLRGDRLVAQEEVQLIALALALTLTLTHMLALTLWLREDAQLLLAERLPRPPATSRDLPRSP